MKNRFVAATAAAVFAVTLVPSSASADTPTCVSRAEWDLVDYDMTMGTVHSIFDFNGTLVSDDGLYKTRGYKSCRDDDPRRAIRYRDNGSDWIVHDKWIMMS